MKNVLVLFSLSGILSGQAIAADRPNPVFILADDLGWSDTTLYGHPARRSSTNCKRSGVIQPNQTGCQP